MPEADRISPDVASTIQSSPNPSLYDLKQQIVRELLVLHQCYSRLNQDSNQPERFMSFVHSLFSLLPPELQLTEAEIAAIDQLVSPNQSPFIPAASQAFLEQLPSVAVSKCPDLINEDCPVCQEPFTAESSLTKSSDDLSNIASRVVELPCEHIFHFSCVAAWMNQHNTCPCCRFKVPTDNAFYNEKVIRQQPEPVRRHQRLKRRACEISQPCIPPPAKRPLCVRSSRCALSAHGLPCLLPVRRSDSPSPEPSADTVEHLACGHSFHLQCLHTALALLGVATLQPDIGPCPLCCLHSASPDSADRLQRMTLPLVSIQPESSRPSSPVQYRISPVPANQHQDRFLR